MIVGKVIKSILAAAGITAEPYPAAQGTTGNLVVYHVISNIPTTRKQGVSKLDTYRVQINSVSATFDGACTLSESIRTALDRYKGTIATYNVDQINFIDEMANYELEDRSHMIIQDYYIRIKNESKIIKNMNFCLGFSLTPRGRSSTELYNILLKEGYLENSVKLKSKKKWHKHQE